MCTISFGRDAWHHRKSMWSFSVYCRMFVQVLGFSVLGIGLSGEETQAFVAEDSSSVVYFFGA